MPVSFTVCGLVEALLVTVTAPLMLPVVLGLNVTLTVQDAPAAMLEPQGVPPPAATEKSPLAAKDKELRVVVRLLVMVSVCAALVLPTTVEAKVRLVGAIVTGRTPVPLRLATCGESLPVSETTTAPETAAAAEGVKVTLMVQLAPAASAPPQGVPPLPTAAKFPAVESVSVTELALEFFTVTVFAALVVPMACFAKVSDAGVNLSGSVEPPVPLPVSFTSSGL